GSHQRYDFRGQPNNGNISAPLTFGKFTLIGNPYPSAVDLDAFFLDHFNTDVTAYFWEQGPTSTHDIATYTGGYGVYSPGGFAMTTGNYVPATFYRYNGDGSYCTTCPSSGNPTPNPDRRYVPIGQGFMVKGDQSPLYPGNSVTMKNSYRVYIPEGPA